MVLVLMENIFRICKPKLSIIWWNVLWLETWLGFGPFGCAIQGKWDILFVKVHNMRKACIFTQYVQYLGLELLDWSCTYCTGICSLYSWSGVPSTCSLRVEKSVTVLNSFLLYFILKICWWEPVFLPCITRH